MTDGHLLAVFAAVIVLIALTTVAISAGAAIHYGWL